MYIYKYRNIDVIYMYVSMYVYKSAISGFVNCVDLDDLVRKVATSATKVASKVEQGQNYKCLM